MRIAVALRLGPKAVVALVGGGGKTTILHRMADELASEGHGVVATTTTIMAAHEVERAPVVLALGAGAPLAGLARALAERGRVMVIGPEPPEPGKAGGVAPEVLARIAAHPAVDAVIAEADGARGRPLKAPAAHEPVLPPGLTNLVPVAGLDAIGELLAEAHVHRPERVAALAGVEVGAPITPEVVAALLAHPAGGAKGLRPEARLTPFLNKADTAERLTAADEIARLLLAHPGVAAVVIGAAAAPDPVCAVWGRTRAVVLAAGGARRFGAAKQVLPWQGRPLVAHVAAQALRCPDIAGVTVTLGADAEAVRDALYEGLRGEPSDGLATTLVPDWEQGQSRSVLTGLRAALAGEAETGEVGALLFLLADQPGITPALLSALVQGHRLTLAPVVAPRYRGRRGNPVLFDRSVFAEFDGLRGDAGARGIVEVHRAAIAWVDWPTPEVVQDIDTVEDYRNPD